MKNKPSTLMTDEEFRKSECAKKKINFTIFGAFAGICIPISIFLMFPSTLVLKESEFLKVEYFQNNLFAIFFLFFFGFVTMVSMGCYPLFNKQKTKKYLANFSLTIGTSLMVMVPSYILLCGYASTDNYYLYFAGIVIGMFVALPMNITRPSSAKPIKLNATLQGK